MTSRSCRLLLTALAALAVLAGCASPGRQPDPAQPEGASGWSAKPGWYAERQMVVAAHPLAARAGHEILQQGGSAVDATIAVQMMLTLVEPQSSGIGGGAFLLHADGRAVEAWDGRETAPAKIPHNLFLQADGRPVPFAELAGSGRSVGVPGLLRMLQQVHSRHGRLPWATLFAPAIRTAQQGFVVSPRLASSLQQHASRFDDPQARAYFLDSQGRPYAAGQVLKNPALARVFQRIAAEGPDAFYKGELAAAIATRVQAHPRAPGTMELADLASYQAVERRPVCGPFMQFRVCGMPPPSAGGIAVLQMLGMLERKGIADLGPKDGLLNERAVHLFAEAGRLAFADRNRYVADPEFAPLPGGSPAALLSPAYLAGRAARIGEASVGIAPAGQPSATALAVEEGHSLESPSTSHVSVVDAAGNAVSMTSSIERAFGSGLMVEGFLLNNQLTDFSLPTRDGELRVANRVEGGKRPRSAMAPTLVFDGRSGKLLMTIGSPGGPAIINYVAKTLVATLAWRMDLQQAISLPNFGSRNGPTEVEAVRFPAPLIDALRRRGHPVVVIEQTSGLHGIQRLPREASTGWFGAADPRREGVALGD